MVNLPGVAQTGRAVAGGCGGRGSQAFAGGSRVGSRGAVGIDACDRTSHRAASTGGVAARPVARTPVRPVAGSCRAAAGQLLACMSRT